MKVIHISLTYIYIVTAMIRVFYHNYIVAHCYLTAYCVVVGKNRHTRDGEQRVTVEQGNGWGCEKAQGKGLSYIYHTHSNTATGHVKHTMHICYVNSVQVKCIQGYRFCKLLSINNPLVLKTMCVYVCVYIY